MSILQKINTISTPDRPTLQPLNTINAMPVPGYNFTVEINDVPIAFFQSCSGLEVKREVLAFSEGGLNDHGQELPGMVTFGHVTFETGFTKSTFFWDWMMSGKGLYDGWVLKKDLVLVHRQPNPVQGDPVFIEVRKWKFINAFPVSWKISDLNVTESSKIVIETIEFSFDYFEKD
jgi:phage tail-like protein